MILLQVSLNSSVNFSFSLSPKLKPAFDRLHSTSWVHESFSEPMSSDWKANTNSWSSSNYWPLLFIKFCQYSGLQNRMSYANNHSIFKGSTKLSEIIHWQKHWPEFLVIISSVLWCFAFDPASFFTYFPQIFLLLDFGVCWWQDLQWSMKSAPLYFTGRFRLTEPSHVNFLIMTST